MLACWDFGGDGRPALLAHGTSLHGRCWAPVASELPAGLRALALDLRGHGCSEPSPDGHYDWARLASDVLAVLDQLGASDVVGVGHSAGATSLLLAEASRPGTFARIWAWEPIMSVPGSDLRSGRSAELAGRARKRRAQWACAQEARQYLEGRGMFAEFSPDALSSFVQGGLRPSPNGNGVTLACDPEVEARVYEEAPAQRAWDALPRLSCPVRVLGGELSPAVPPEHVQAMTARTPGAGAVIWPGCGHFGPFCAPGPVAADIAGWALGAGPGRP